MVKCNESSQVQAELEEFKLIGGRELCIVFRKMFTCLRSWVSNPQLVRFHYAARGLISIETNLCAVPSKIQYNLITLSQSTSGCQCDGVLSAED